LVEAAVAQNKQMLPVCCLLYWRQFNHFKESTHDHDVLELARPLASVSWLAPLLCWFSSQWSRVFSGRGTGGRFQT